MPFFKEGDAARDRRVARIEAWVWILVYGGLLAVVLGVFMGRQQEGTGIFLVVGGCIATAIGALLVYLRSRMQ